MIASILLAAQVKVAAVRIVEIIEPAAARVEIQAVVSLPPSLSPRERGALMIIREMLVLGTDNYTKNRLLDLALLNGDPIRVSLSFDHFRIGFSLPANSEDVGADMVSNLLRNALFREDEFASALALAPFRSYPAWPSALGNGERDFRSLRLSELRQVYQRLFRPENVTVAVGGVFTSGAFLRKFADWAPAPARAINPGKPQELYKSHPVNTVALWADLGDVPYPQLELTAIALGLGKDGAAFRVVRNQLGQSYRQEGVVSPGPAGLRLGVVYQSSAPDAPAALAALAKDIETWSDLTLKRAQATIKALDALGMGYSSVYLDPAGPLTSSLPDRCYWAAYAAAHKLPQDRKLVLTAMGSVSLDQLKSTAKRWASEAKIVITP